MVGVLRTADDRFASHVEAGINDNAVASKRLKLPNQLPISRINVFGHALNPGRVIDVRDGRNIGPQKVKTFVQAFFVIVIRSRYSLLRPNGSYYQHIGGRTIQLEISLDV